MRRGDLVAAGKSMLLRVALSRVAILKEESEYHRSVAASLMQEAIDLERSIEVTRNEART